MVAGIRDAPPSATLSIVFVAITTGAVSYVTLAYALARTTSAGQTSAVLYLVPPLVGRRSPGRCSTRRRRPSRWPAARWPWSASRSASDNPQMRQVNSDASLRGGTYSHAVVDGDHVFLAGQIAADRPDPPPLGDIEVETRTCMELIQAVLAEVGLTFADVRAGRRVHDRPGRVRAAWIASTPRFCRSATHRRAPPSGVAQILFGCRIEIDCVARIADTGLTGPGAVCTVPRRTVCSLAPRGPGGTRGMGV